MRFWLPGGSHNLLHMRLVISIVKCCPNLQRSYNVLHSPPNFPNMSTFLLHNSNPFSIVTLQITSTHNTTSRPSSLHPGGIAVSFTSWYIAIVSNLQKKNKIWRAKSPQPCSVHFQTRCGNCLPGWVSMASSLRTALAVASTELRVRIWWVFNRIGFKDGWASAWKRLPLLVTCVSATMVFHWCCNELSQCWCLELSVSQF